MRVSVREEFVVGVKNVIAHPAERAVERLRRQIGFGCGQIHACAASQPGLLLGFRVTIIMRMFDSQKEILLSIEKKASLKRNCLYDLGS